MIDYMYKKTMPVISYQHKINYISKGALVENAFHIIGQLVKLYFNHIYFDWI